MHSAGHCVLPWAFMGPQVTPVLATQCLPQMLSRLAWVKQCVTFLKPASAYCGGPRNMWWLTSMLMVTVLARGSTCITWPASTPR